MSATQSTLINQIFRLSFSDARSVCDPLHRIRYTWIRQETEMGSGREIGGKHRVMDHKERGQLQGHPGRLHKLLIPGNVRPPPRPRHSHSR